MPGATLEEIVEQLRRAVADSKTTPQMQGEKAGNSKVYNPKLVLQEREKLLAAHKRALERRREKEMQECTFRPMITRRSMEMVAANPRVFSPLHEPKVVKENPPAPKSVSPTINPVSRALAAQKEREGPIYDRLMRFARICKDKLERKKEERRVEEMKNVYGVPHINKYSEELTKRKTSNGVLPQNTLDRLIDFELQKREQHLKRLGEQAEEEIRRATTPKKFVSTNSRRILDHMHPSAFVLQDTSEQHCQTTLQSTPQTMFDMIDCESPSTADENASRQRSSDNTTNQSLILDQSDSHTEATAKRNDKFEASADDSEDHSQQAEKFMLNDGDDFQLKDQIANHVKNDNRLLEEIKLRKLAERELSVLCQEHKEFIIRHEELQRLNDQINQENEALQAKLQEAKAQLDQAESLRTERTELIAANEKLTVELEVVKAEKEKTRSELSLIAQKCKAVIKLNSQLMQQNNDLQQQQTKGTQ